jgi:signal transduction histidine kinase
MNFPRTYNRAFLYAIVFTIVVTLTAVFIYSSLSKWQNTMVEKTKLICELYANKLYNSAIIDIDSLGKEGLFGKKDLSSYEIKRLDSVLKKLSHEELEVRAGLEGGFYLRGLDDFYGYAFPTSPPPIPVYGPPPRSYNIIKTQALQSISENRFIVGLHAFDAAIFPLATKPFVFSSTVAGVIWVRIHIQDDLPIIKLKQVVNIAAIVSILCFIVLMLVSALWGGEIQGIKNEMENIRNDPELRLRKRWGIFGYISSNINQMLETIDKENMQRHLLERQLNQKEKLASLGNMIAGVAHEVKTPLAIIKTRIQMWQLEAEKNAVISSHISPESMQIVINETNRLTNLVKKLLIFSRPIDKKIKDTDINKVINEVVDFIMVERNDKRVSIKCNLSTGLPLIPADENSIKQVFINVLENSYEAISDGGTINIDSKKDPSCEKLEISITDNGKGIPKDIINNVFEPFFTSKEAGVGLGLAISYQIIKAHNGEIFFSDSYDNGTRCVIKLPVSQ